MRWSSPGTAACPLASKKLDTVVPMGEGAGMQDEDEFSPDPIPFWPIELVPEDDDRVIEQALIEERWARLDALAGRVG